MVMVQVKICRDGKNILGEQCSTLLKKNNVQKYENMKYNFDAETVNVRINKSLNAKLLKFNMLYTRSSVYH